MPARCIKWLMDSERSAEIKKLGILDLSPVGLPNWAGRVVLETGFSPADARVLTYGVEQDLKNTSDLANVSIGDLDTNGSLSSFNQRLDSVSITDYMEDGLHLTRPLDEFRNWLDNWDISLSENGIIFHSLEKAKEAYSDYLEMGRHLLTSANLNDQ